MARTIQDENLMLWEAFAVAGDFGFPDHSKLIFQCLSDPGRRARVLEREGDLSDVEGELVRLSDTDLVALLEETEEVA